MIYKKFHDDFILSSTIGLGCGVFSTDKEQKSDEDNGTILKTAIDNGINLFDTAEVYGNGKSEEKLGKFLWEYTNRSSVILCSKVSPENLYPRNIVLSVENSLKRLKTDYLDIYYIHWPNPNIPIEDTVGTFIQLKTDGKIRGFGLSNFFDIKQINKIESMCHIDSIEMEYNIFERLVESDIVPFCRKNNSSFVAYSPLNQSAVNRNDARVQKTEWLCKKYNKTFFQIILKWLHSKENVFPIPKSSKINHLIDNIGSVEFDMEDTDNAFLSETFKFKIISIKPSEINTHSSGRESQLSYLTVEDAMKNSLNFSPSPCSLAEDIKKGYVLKPIKVVCKDGQYFLIEGRLRYWAWVIAFGFDVPICATINEI